MERRQSSSNHLPTATFYQMANHAKSYIPSCCGPILDGAILDINSTVMAETAVAPPNTHPTRHSPRHPALRHIPNNHHPPLCHQSNHPAKLESIRHLVHTIRPLHLLGTKRHGRTQPKTNTTRLTTAPQHSHQSHTTNLTKTTPTKRRHGSRLHTTGHPTP